MPNLRSEMESFLFLFLLLFLEVKIILYTYRNQTLTMQISFDKAFNCLNCSLIYVKGFRDSSMCQNTIKSKFQSNCICHPALFYTSNTIICLIIVICSQIRRVKNYLGTTLNNVNNMKSLMFVKFRKSEGLPTDHSNYP